MIPDETLWQRAWDDAQPRLDAIRSSLSSMTPPLARVMRVGKLDAELLDEELIQLLKEPVSKALGVLNSALNAEFNPELELVLRAVLYKLSVWDQGATYGAKLQDLRYKAPRTSSRLAPSGLPARTLAAHAALTVILPYLHTRLRSHGLSNAWPDRPASDLRRRTWELLARAESIHALLGVLTFVAFLWDGRYRTVADRIMRMQLVPTRSIVTRNVNYAFMNRQMVWHAFTEFLLFLLPLINARALRRRLFKSLTRIPWSAAFPQPSRAALGLSSPATDAKGKGKAGPSQAQQRGKYWRLPVDQCAICAENASFSLDVSDPRALFSSAVSSTLNSAADAVMAGVGPSSSASTAAVGAAGTNMGGAHEEDAEPPSYPIHIPYATSCGHIYCYYCVAERMIRAHEDGEDMWECLRCTQPIVSAGRLLGQDPEPSDLAIFNEDDFTTETSDLSRSTGSLSFTSEE